MKWLDMKEPNPSLLNVRQLKGRSVNGELDAPPIREPPQTQYMGIV